MWLQCGAFFLRELSQTEILPEALVSHATVAVEAHVAHALSNKGKKSLKRDQPVSWMKQEAVQRRCACDVPPPSLRMEN